MTDIRDVPIDEMFEWKEPPPPGPYDDGVREPQLSPLQTFCKRVAERPGQWAVFRIDWLPWGVGQLERLHPEVEWTYRRNPEVAWITQADGRVRPTHTVYGRFRADGPGSVQRTPPVQPGPPTPPPTVTA